MIWLTTVAVEYQNITHSPVFIMSNPSAPPSAVYITEADKYDASVERISNFINGRFVPPSDGSFLPNLNPATNAPLCLIPASKSADVQEAVKAARAAFPAWAELGYEKRAALLDALANAIERDAEEMASWESEDSGKPLSLARRIDVPRAVSNFRFFAGAVRHDEVGAHHMSDALNYTVRHPVGVAGLITPWNLPIYLLSWKVAPALAMGNTVVAKPSEITPRTAHKLAMLAKEVGIPDGVLNIVHGYGWDAGQALCEHPDVNLISFTGGTVTGRKVAATAAPMFKKLSLELGGKNATVVFADCDWEKTVAGTARAAFTNQGQVCLAGSRIFIEESIYDRFVEALVKEVSKLQCGDPKSADFGAVSSLQHLAKIESYVELARNHEGVRILCGGKRAALPPPFDQGAFYVPTLIAGLPHDHRCSVEEIFGPVATVHKFKDESEVIDMINVTRYGLAGSIWTENLTRAHRVAKKWETGMVWVNCWLHRDLRVPFGGIKESGVGTEGGKHSLEFYSQYKNVCIHLGAQ